VLVASGQNEVARKSQREEWPATARHEDKASKLMQALNGTASIPVTMSLREYKRET